MDAITERASVATGADAARALAAAILDADDMTDEKLAEVMRAVHGMPCEATRRMCELMAARLQ